MNIQELLAFEDYKDGLKLLYEEFDLTLGYETEEINEEEYKQELDEYGIQFSDSPEDRRKQVENNKFLKDTYGWDLTELWDLDRSIIVFLLPRLYVFYKTDITLESEYDEGTFGYILETILEGLLLVLEEYTNSKYDEKQFLYKEAKTKEAFMLLGKYMQRLWN